MLHPDAVRSVTGYLAVADRLLPGRITGFYVVGSAALGAWRAGRSDIDCVAVVEGDLSARDVRRLRVLHPAGNARAVGRALVRVRPAVPGTMNGVFVSAGDLGRPVTEIRPLASHTGPSFGRGRGFDVNPVVWKVLRERGITVRGQAPAELGLDPEPDRLRAWNLDNLHGYWRSWADRALAGRVRSLPFVPARWMAESLAAWGALGPPRLHHTIATGEVIPKETAGEYALDTFGVRWHSLIRAALAHRRGEPATAWPDPSLADPERRVRLVGEFILEVIADADRL